METFNADHGLVINLVIWMFIIQIGMRWAAKSPARLKAFAVITFVTTIAGVAGYVLGLTTVYWFFQILVPTFFLALSWSSYHVEHKASSDI